MWEPVGSLGSPMPALFTARTLNWYCWPSFSPDTRVSQSGFWDKSQIKHKIIKYQQIEIANKIIARYSLVLNATYIGCVNFFPAAAESLLLFDDVASNWYSTCVFRCSPFQVDVTHVPIDNFGSSRFSRRIYINKPQRGKNVFNILPVFIFS